MKETAVEWLVEQWPILESQIPERILDQAKEMEREQMIYIIETYHNNLFYLPLSENGEAHRILDLILTGQIKSKP